MTIRKRLEHARGSVAVLLLTFAIWLVLAPMPDGRAQRAIDEATFFRPDRIWTIELSFTADAWSAVRPRVGSRPTFLPSSDARFRNGMSGMMGVSFEYASADAAIDGVTFGNVGVRIKGNGSFFTARPIGMSSTPEAIRAMSEDAKVPFKVDLNRFVPGQRLGRISTFNLHNNLTDPGWMNETLAYRLFRDAGVPAPRTSWAKVFITVPGRFSREYFGLYSIVEEVDEAFLENRLGEHNGALLKPTSPFNYVGPDWLQYGQTYDPKTPLSEAQIARIIEFCRLVTEGTDEAFAARAGTFVDLDAFAKFMAPTVWLANSDSILVGRQNYYAYLGTNNRFAFIPWDHDHSFGQPPNGVPERAHTLNIHAPGILPQNRFLNRMFALPEFKRLYLARLGELCRTLLAPERLAASVDELAPLLRPAIAAESQEMLARFEMSVAGERLSRPPNSGSASLVPIKPFARARTASVLAQLAEAR